MVDYRFYLSDLEYSSGYSLDGIIQFEHHSFVWMSRSKFELSTHSVLISLSNISTTHYVRYL